MKTTRNGSSAAARELMFKTTRNTSEITEGNFEKTTGNG